MKNFKHFLFAGLLFLVTTANAQPPRMGAKAGLNYASLSGYDGDHFMSFHAGVFVHTALDKKWRIQPELLYSKEGQHYMVDGIKNTLELSYVAVPIALQYFPTTSFYLEAGPQLAVLMSAYSKTTSESHQNIKRSFANGQAGLAFGAGVFLKDRISLYGRYHLGLTDVTPHNDNSDKSRTGQIGLSYRFK